MRVEGALAIPTKSVTQKGTKSKTRLVIVFTRNRHSTSPSPPSPLLLPIIDNAIITCQPPINPSLDDDRSCDNLVEASTSSATSSRDNQQLSSSTTTRPPSTFSSSSSSRQLSPSTRAHARQGVPISEHRRRGRPRRVVDKHAARQRRP